MCRQLALLDVLRCRGRQEQGRADVGLFLELAEQLDTAPRQCGAVDEHQVDRPDLLRLHTRRRAEWPRDQAIERREPGLPRDSRTTPAVDYQDSSPHYGPRSTLGKHRTARPAIRVVRAVMPLTRYPYPL